MGKGNKASLGCLFWIAIFLLAVVLFIFNQKNIVQFINRFQNNEAKNTSAPSVVTTHLENKPTPSSNNSATTDLPEGTHSPIPSPGYNIESKIIPSPTVSIKTQTALRKNYRTSVLYFIVRNENDQIKLTTVKRQVVHDDAPLTETLQVLLQGPTASEKKSLLLTLIPQATTLKDVYVQGNIAYISFNDEFRFNVNGVPGLVAQVKQVVYTATEFPNITKVQILINGKKVEYLAQEGVFIGAPLSRSSL